jgi:hypothetical protein
VKILTGFYIPEKNAKKGGFLTRGFLQGAAEERYTH